MHLPKTRKLEVNVVAFVYIKMQQLTKLNLTPTSSLSGSDLTCLGFSLVLEFSAVEFS